MIEQKTEARGAHFKNKVKLCKSYNLQSRFIANSIVLLKK